MLSLVAETASLVPGNKTLSRRRPSQAAFSRGHVSPRTSRLAQTLPTLQACPAWRQVVCSPTRTPKGNTFLTHQAALPPTTMLTCHLTTLVPPSPECRPRLPGKVKPAWKCLGTIGRVLFSGNRLVGSWQSCPFTEKAGPQALPSEKSLAVCKSRFLSRHRSEGARDAFKGAQSHARIWAA